MQAFRFKFNDYVGVATGTVLAAAIMYLGVLLPEYAAQDWWAAQEPMTFYWLVKPISVLVQVAILTVGYVKVMEFLWGGLKKRFRVRTAPSTSESDAVSEVDG